MGRKKRRRKVIAAEFLSNISFDGYYQGQNSSQIVQNTGTREGGLIGFCSTCSAASHDLCSCTANTEHVDVHIKAVNTTEDTCKSSFVSGYLARGVGDQLQTLNEEHRNIHVLSNDCTTLWDQLPRSDFVRTVVCTNSGVAEPCTIAVPNKQSHQNNIELNIGIGSFSLRPELLSKGCRRVTLCPVGHCTTRLAVFSVIPHGRKHGQSISRATARTSKLLINSSKDVSTGHFPYVKQQQVASQQPIQRSQPQTHVQQSMSNSSSSVEPMLTAFVADSSRSLSSMRPMFDEELSFSSLLKPQINLWLSSPYAWTHPKTGCVPRAVREPDASGLGTAEGLTAISNEISVCNFLRSGLLAAFSTTSNRPQTHLSSASLGPVPHWQRTAQALSRARNTSGGSTSPLPSVTGYPGVPSTVVAYPDPLVYYLPSLLDDPDLLVATGKRVLKLPNYLTTVITYVRPSEQKRNVNREFQGRFPFIQLTLTKLRSIKSVMVQLIQRLSLDLWVAAHAHVLFEKLILRLLVNKSNRRLCAAAVLVISAKLNDVKGTELSALFQELENNFKISRRDMIHTELDVTLSLEFCLIPNEQEIVVHYLRIYKNLDLAPPCLLPCYRNMSQSASLPSVVVPD